ncbi:hypothetical protein BJX61DRAFT_109179 [Aspergillus egyptiacus]|nr:hypothetical protein BJX61DRAFT_109179 [Aspergillus egyptiacus]
MGAAGEGAATVVVVVIPAEGAFTHQHCQTLAEGVLTSLPSAEGPNSSSRSEGGEGKCDATDRGEGRGGQVPLALSRSNRKNSISRYIRSAKYLKLETNSQAARPLGSLKACSAKPGPRSSEVALAT